VDRYTGLFRQVGQVIALFGHYRRRRYQPIQDMMTDDHRNGHAANHRLAVKPSLSQFIDLVTT
jgi:hypothetical protein